MTTVDKTSHLFLLESGGVDNLYCTGCLKNSALKLLYVVQKHLVGEEKIFKKFLVFISLHNESFCKDL
jgi:hypothetical protein